MAVSPRRSSRQDVLRPASNLAVFLTVFVRTAQSLKVLVVGQAPTTSKPDIDLWMASLNVPDEQSIGNGSPLSGRGRSSLPWCLLRLNVAAPETWYTKSWSRQHRLHHPLRWCHAADDSFSRGSESKKLKLTPFLLTAAAAVLLKLSGGTTGLYAVL